MQSSSKTLSSDSDFCILVAGASGYVGRALIVKLLQKFPRARIIALSRTRQNSKDPRVEWKACDLFSLRSIEEALPRFVNLAYYLVHSMGPTAHLDQGSFSDYDLLLADNFARALKKVNLEHLVYLGGLVDEASVKLSDHLQSRLEVEQVFQEHSLPVTVFRAGLILGSEGSSFQMLIKLVQRLPLMMCPRWTQTLNTPVDLDRVLYALVDCAFGEPHHGRIYDLAGCRPLTYLDMMKKTAQFLGVRRFFVPVPFFSPHFSRLWVSLVTGASRGLVYPLIESLAHPMVARSENSYFRNESLNTYSDLLKKILVPQNSWSFFGAFKFRFQFSKKTVRSVQRLPLPRGTDALWVKEQYFSWLPQFLSSLISVRVRGSSLVFCFLRTNLVLIELGHNKERSTSDRQLLYVEGGLLVGESHRGRLEFRTVLKQKYVLAAIHDFRPSLPWFIYKYTQALLHLWVMKAFSRHLQNYPKSD